VLPIFWDQHDNARRVDETGYGIRLPTYSFEERDLHAALERVLADGALRARCAAASTRLRASPGTETAATLIERLAISGEPVARAA
jgi:UDP:flavonoid glycosyltransferase YjiC (YdhE family)